MSRRIQHAHRSRRHKALRIAICLALTAYFAQHALQGRHGLSARSKLEARQPEVARELAALKAARTVLEQEVALLTPDPPHPDMIDEIARTMLGYVAPADMVFIGR